jgi:hypothetical protein
MASPTPLTVDIRRAPRAGVSTTRSRSIMLPAPATRASSPAARSLTSGPPPPVLASATSTPAIDEPGFTGLSAGGPLTNLEPADSSVAVGPDNVVQIVNAGIRFTNRVGKLSVADLGLGTFFAAAGRTVSSPRVIYDALHGRWLAIEESWDCTPDAKALFGHGYIDLAVSRTTDPTGIWDVYPLKFNDQLPDMATVGVSTDKVGLSANVYPFESRCTFGTTFTGSYLAAIDWSGLTARHGTIIGNNLTDPGRFGVQVADQVPAISSALQFIDQANDGSGDVEYFMADGTTSAMTFAFNPSFDLASYGVAGPSLPLGGLLPQQPGPSAITADIDNRLTGAVWRDSKLVTVSTYPCRPTGDDADRLCVRVTELNTSIVDALTPPGLVQDFLLNDLGRDTYVGGVGLSGNGTLHVVFNRSSAIAGDFGSSYDVAQLPTDPPNSTGAPSLIQPGQDIYHGTEWGDYTSLAQDPQVPDAVWQADEFVNVAHQWSTYVDQLGRTTGTTYVPIVPVRILDSRFGTGLSGLSGKFVASVARTFSVAGLGSIPAAAVAVTGNVTVTRQNAAGYVAVTPTAQANPPSSTLNFPLTGDRANNVTVPLSSAGTLSMTFKAGAGRTTDLVFDVTGYFLPDDSAATYHPVTPTRLLDSRFGTGQPGGTPAKFLAGVPQTFTVGGGLTIPVAATAITGNVTVTRQTKAGYLAITPDPTASPPASTLNFPLADDRANGFTAPLNTSHQLSIVYITATGAKTDVVLDVTGYYLADLTGLHFYPLNPGRIMDTRPGVANSGLTGPFGSSVPRDLATVGHWAIPTGAQALTGNLTVTGQTSSGYAAITPTPDANPPTSTLNFPLGDNRANGVTVPLSGTGSLWLVFKGGSGRMTNLILDVTGYFQ